MCTGGVYVKVKGTLVRRAAELKACAVRPPPILHVPSRCLLCHHTPVLSATDNRTVTISCPGCRAVLSIEFYPPDQPGLRARIERLDDRDGPSRTTHAVSDFEQTNCVRN